MRACVLVLVCACLEVCKVVGSVLGSYPQDANSIRQPTVITRKHLQTLLNVSRVHSRPQFRTTALRIFCLVLPLVTAIHFDCAGLPRAFHTGRRGGAPGHTEREEAQGKMPSSWPQGVYSLNVFLNSSLGPRPTRYKQNDSSGGAIRFSNKDDKEHIFSVRPV